MTSATFTRPARTLSRRRLRIAAAAAGLTGALALTACSGGDSKDSSSSSPSPSASSAASSATGGGSGAATSSSDELQGSWLATKGGKAVALVITGKQAGLFSTGGSVCSGTAGKEAGMEMIHLTCTDGSKERATGMVDSASKDSLHITWSGSLGKETYTKAEGGKLPSGLPTTGLGQ
ncbi:hypothetical protein PO587_31085 [Streptomyces gilvifuscus]|uniref:Lipoprotein n=1 Tax=Streptomyces gilvifuscus TaxID=1550617 RepID=A0ABT5G2P6_9ACTN|nr:hypothetical protein [Streptomyces gilvifuscus]MDC2958892.1 hypothetical protein [Streptomyces gilvifuscus]